MTKQYFLNRKCTIFKNVSGNIVANRLGFQVSWKIKIYRFKSSNKCWARQKTGKPPSVHCKPKTNCGCGRQTPRARAPWLFPGWARCLRCSQCWLLFLALAVCEKTAQFLFFCDVHSGEWWLTYGRNTEAFVNGGGGGWKLFLRNILLRDCKTMKFKHPREK